MFSYQTIAPDRKIEGARYLMAARRYTEAADYYGCVDKYVTDYNNGFYSIEIINSLLLPKLRADLLAGRKDSALHVARQLTEVFDSAYKKSAKRSACCHHAPYFP